MILFPVEMEYNSEIIYITFIKNEPPIPRLGRRLANKQKYIGWGFTSTFDVGNPQIVQRR